MGRPETQAGRPASAAGERPAGGGPGLRPGPRGLVQSLDRGLRMLEDLIVAGQPLRLRDFAAKYGVDRASAFRFLATLEAAGLAAKDPVTKGYTPGRRLWTWLATIRQELRLVDVVRPHLVDLTRASGGSGHVAVLDADQALLVDYVPSDTMVTVRNRVGVHEPLHCTAVGKALLAFLPEAERERLVQRLPLTRHTARTIDSRDGLRRELARVRRVGAAVDQAEYSELLMCVAAPVLGPGGRVLGSVGISMVRPLVQRAPGRMTRLVPLVKACGARVSAELAGRADGQPGSRERTGGR